MALRMACAALTNCFRSAVYNVTSFRSVCGGNSDKCAPLVFNHSGVEIEE